MKTLSAFVLALLPLLTGCGGAPSGPEPAATPPTAAAAQDPARPLPSPLPEIAARVNGESIPFFRILPLAQVELEAIPQSEQEARMPEAVRRALDRYIDRELLFQEAIRRDVSVDQRALDWAYDQARAAHPGDEPWALFLGERGMDEKSFRAELRVQHTVSALLEQKAQEGGEAAVDAGESPQAAAARPLLERLRAEARIESFI
jgi:hypothetical protein